VYCVRSRVICASRGLYTGFVVYRIWLLGRRLGSGLGGGLGGGLLGGGLGGGLGSGLGSGLGVASDPS
jgi:hypothetical protein